MNFVTKFFMPVAFLCGSLIGPPSFADCVPSNYSGKAIRYVLSRGANCPQTVTIKGGGNSLDIYMPELAVRSNYVGGGMTSFAVSFEKSQLGTGIWWSPTQPSKQFSCSENLKELLYNRCYYRAQ